MVDVVKLKHEGFNEGRLQFLIENFILCNWSFIKNNPRGQYLVLRAILIPIFVTLILSFLIFVMLFSYNLVHSDACWKDTLSMMKGFCEATFSIKSLFITPIGIKLNGYIVGLKNIFCIGIFSAEKEFIFNDYALDWSQKL